MPCALSFEVVAAASTEVTGFWDVMPCTLMYHITHQVDETCSTFAVGPLLKACKC